MYGGRFNEVVPDAFRVVNDADVVARVPRSDPPPNDVFLLCCKVDRGTDLLLKMTRAYEMAPTPRTSLSRARSGW